MEVLSQKYFPTGRGAPDYYIFSLPLPPKVMGSKVAPLKRVVHGSVEWARLEPAGETSVSQFVDSICQDTSSTGRATLLKSSIILACIYSRPSLFIAVAGLFLKQCVSLYSLSLLLYSVLMHTVPPTIGIS